MPGINAGSLALCAGLQDPTPRWPVTNEPARPRIRPTRRDDYAAEVRLRCPNQTFEEKLATRTSGPSHRVTGEVITPVVPIKRRRGGEQPPLDQIEDCRAVVRVSRTAAQASGLRFGAPIMAE